MSTSLDSCAVKIAVRERPLREHLKSNDPSVIRYHSLNPNVVIADNRVFSFDQVLGSGVSQRQIYDDLIKPLIGRVLEGFNCTALAYGQTGTGKSYTMGLSSNSFEGENVGVIPRCLNELLCVEKEDETLSGSGVEISASFIEIYNEKVYDLLSEASAEPIAARGSKFTGSTRTCLKNIQECYNILNQGNKNRHVRPTKMNSQSSRSHAIFTIHVRNVNKGGDSISSCLNLVDLAGSEGVRRTGHQGVALSEGVHINQGLLSIGKVLQAMTMGNKVIPYRDSVLSSVLQDSLNPNSYLTLLACISPHKEDLSETLSTLRFAQNAKQLKHTPQINTILEEIRRTKVKTPLSVKTPRKFSYPHIAPISSAITSARKRKAVHSNTFCTPGKIKKTENVKFNQTEMGMTPRAKEKCSILPTLSSLYSDRESNFGHNDSIDLRSSIFSLNVSTSTVVDAPTNKVTSPVMPKSMNGFEQIMEKKLAQIMESLKTEICTNVLKELSQTRNGITDCNSARILDSSIQLPLSSLRQELGNIAHEFLEKNSDKENIDRVANERDESPITLIPDSPKVKCQLFAETSPVFKVPVTSRPRNNIPNSSTADNYIAEGIEKTGQSSSIRRSRRISTRMFNDSKISETSFALPQRRSIRLISANENKMCQSILDSKITNTTLSASGNKTVFKTPQRRKKITQVLNNSIIASYFDSSHHETKSNKNQNISKHRKAVLHLLNTGSIKELQLLPQVGQKTAYQIITQRTLNGKFKNIGQVEKLPIWRGTTWERFAKMNMLL